MKSLFYKIVVSFFLAVVILLGLEWIVGFGLSNNRNFKISYISKQKIAAEVLAHGPCESEWAIDPDIISQCVDKNTYNLSLNHSDFADNYIFLKQYLKYQPKPKVVLLYVTPESFDSVIANTFNTYRFVHLLHDNTVRDIVHEMDDKFAKISRLPFLRYSYYSNFIFYKSFSGWIDFVTGNKTPQWPNGQIKPIMPWNMAFNHFRDLNPKEGHFLWSKSREKYFLNIIHLLQTQQIPVILYESPVYYEALPYQKNRDLHMKKIDSICQIYDIPFLKFDSLDMRFDKTNYFTTYNFTTKGNDIFNPILGKVLKDTLPMILNKQVNRQ
jgi:hypothetical protein